MNVTMMMQRLLPMATCVAMAACSSTPEENEKPIQLDLWGIGCKSGGKMAQTLWEDAPKTVRISLKDCLGQVNLAYSAQKTSESDTPVTGTLLGVAYVSGIYRDLYPDLFSLGNMNNRPEDVFSDEHDLSRSFFHPRTESSEVSEGEFILMVPEDVRHSFTLRFYGSDGQRFSSGLTAAIDVER